jgi:hypothetical protein
MSRQLGLKPLSLDAVDDARANLRYLAAIAASVLAILAVVGSVHLVQHHRQASADAKWQQELTHAMFCDEYRLSIVECSLTK